MLAEISRALELRDRMRGHGDRVTALAEAIALRLGWDADRLATLRYAAPLHDIGQVAVPREILAKRAPLTPDERVEMQCHPGAGASLVEPIRSARHALPYVLYHHERWDGGGYPIGMRGGEIPIEARVVAVADAFDAMTSPRPYRPPFTTERALEAVAAQAVSSIRRPPLRCSRSGAAACSATSPRRRPSNPVPAQAAPGRCGPPRGLQIQRNDRHSRFRRRFATTTLPG